MPDTPFSFGPVLREQVSHVSTLEDLLASGNVTDVLEQALTQAAQTGAISSVQARTLRNVVDQRR